MVKIENINQEGKIITIESDVYDRLNEVEEYISELYATQNFNLEYEKMSGGSSSERVL